MPSPLRPPRIGSTTTQVGHTPLVAGWQRLKALERAGVEYIGLCHGESDLETPDHVRAAAKAAIDRGQTRYTEVTGTTELRAAAAEWLGRAHGLHLEPDEVIVCSGAKHVLYNIFVALLDEGDEVIIPTPSWPQYAATVALAGGRPVLVPTRFEDGFQIDPAAIERAVTGRSKALLLAQPCNPTGALCSAEVARAVADICARHQVLVVSDDVLRALHYDTDFVSLVGAAHRAGAPIAIIDGVSKMYRMSGFRIGFGAGHRALIHAMATIQGSSTICPSSISEAAALAAITGPQDCVHELVQEYRRRMRAIVSGLESLPRFRSYTPQGGYFVFPDVRAWFGARTADGRQLADDSDLASFLLDEARVAVDAGASFHMPGYLRVVYASAPVPVIEEAFERLRRALATLTPAA